MKLITLTLAAFCATIAPRTARAQYGSVTPQQMMQQTFGYTSGEYYREEVRRMMREGGGRTGPRGANERVGDYGRRVMEAGGTTTKFQTRPFPVEATVEEWAKTNPKGRAGALAEWKTQSALWQQEAKARGARFNDMGDMYALAVVMSYEAYTGKRVSNAGFEQQAKEFGEFFASMSAYQGYDTAEKQNFYENAMLRASNALRLRRAGKIAEARAGGESFLHDWATGKLPGALQTLAPFEGASASRAVAVAPRQNAVSYATAQRATRFSPVAPILPTLLAGQEAPAKREESRKLYTALLEAGRTKMREVFPSQGQTANVAQAMSYAVMTFYVVGNDSKPQITPQTATSLERQFTNILGGAAKFRGQNARQKQQMFEGAVLMAAFVGALNSEAQKSGDAKAKAQVRQIARKGLQNIVGASADEVRLTNAGLEF